MRYLVFAYTDGHQKGGARDLIFGSEKLSNAEKVCRDNNKDNKMSHVYDTESGSVLTFRGGLNE